MPERKIDPKFNIHENYTKVHIINPYRFGTTPPIPSDYEPETNAYISRVEVDGGTVVDKDYIDSVYKKLKELGLLNYVVHWSSAYGGHKKDASNNILKLYSIDQGNNDAVQVDTGFTPTYVEPNIVYNFNKFLTGPQVSTDNFSVISVSSVNSTTETQGFISTYTGTEGILLWLKANGQVAIGFRTTSALIQAGSIAITPSTKYIIGGTYNQTGLKFFLNNIKLGETASSAAINNGYSVLNFGRYQSNELSGRQNEQVVFNIGLSDSQYSSVNTLINSKHAAY